MYYAIDIDTKLSAIKLVHARWIISLYDKFRNDPEMIIKAFDMAFTNIRTLFITACGLFMAPKILCPNFFEVNVLNFKRPFGGAIKGVEGWVWVGCGQQLAENHVKNHSYIGADSPAYPSPQQIIK